MNILYRTPQELQRQVRSELISMKQRLVDEMDNDDQEGEGQNDAESRGQNNDDESRDHPSTSSESRQPEVGYLPASSPNKPAIDVE